MRLFPRFLLCIGWLLAAGCVAPAASLPHQGPGPAEAVTPASSSIPTSLPPRVAAASDQQVEQFFTHHRADGNRFAAGTGHFPDVAPVDIPLAGEPRWLVAAPWDGGSLWVAVLENGQVQGVLLRGEAVTSVPVAPDRLPPDAPPVLVVRDGHASLLTVPEDASPLTAPLLLPDHDLLAYVARNGDLVLLRGSEEMARFPVHALPDARIVGDEEGRLLLLTDATDVRYTHGVLGDRLEAASITLVETSPTPRVVARMELPAPQVVEGIAPIWADMTGDGVREIIVTVSDGDQGARIVAFNEAGERVLAGPAIGRGHRWRDQLAVAPFGPDAALELADDLTPHIGGVVEFYRPDLAAGRLEIVAQVPGYSTHVLGSRNLGMALAGDFDGDGRVELLAPSQDKRHLAGIRRTAGGAEVTWQLPTGGHITTNLAAVTSADGHLLLGLGRSDKILRVWP